MSDVNDYNQKIDIFYKYVRTNFFVTKYAFVVRQVIATPVSGSLSSSKEGKKSHHESDYMIVHECLSHYRSSVFILIKYLSLKAYHFFMCIVTCILQDILEDILQ